MLRICITGLLLLVVLPYSASADQPADIAALEGTWVVQNAELSGQKFPQEVASTMSITMKEGHYITRVGNTLDKGTYEVDADDNPATIDIVGTEGPNKGKTLQGIYRLAGNSLLVCYDLTGKGRPEEFKSLAGTQYFLVNYKRE